MIVKNEEDTLARCLISVRDLVDEIIIVDTGSTDKTKEIAELFTNKIYDFKWVNDFSVARNFSFSKATMDYIFWLDADDVLLDDDRRKFKVVKEKLNSGVDVVMMNYNYAFDDKGKVVLSHYRERILKREKNFVWSDPIHEYTNFSGNIVNCDVVVTHRKTHTNNRRNLDILENMVKEGKELSPRNMFYMAREKFNVGEYDGAIEYFNKHLDTDKGLPADNITSCIHLAKAYRIKKDFKNMKRTLARSFEYDTPRAEICCLMGYCYKDNEDYKRAITWFQLATKLEKPESSWGPVLHEYWGLIPCLELCVCYYKLGNLEEALKYNNKAEEYNPTNPSVLQNKRNLEGMLKKSS
jgi:glycosyltransferase involved in cell wall biosynthesis